MRNVRRVWACLVLHRYQARNVLRSQTKEWNSEFFFHTLKADQACTKAGLDQEEFTLISSKIRHSNCQIAEIANATGTQNCTQSVNVGFHFTTIHLSCSDVKIAFISLTVKTSTEASWTCVCSSQHIHNIYNIYNIIIYNICNIVKQTDGLREYVL